MKNLLLIMIAMLAICGHLGAQEVKELGVFKIAVIPEGSSYAERLTCNLATNRIECGSSEEGSCDISANLGFSCGVFISDHDRELCLGLEKPSRDPKKNVTVVSCQTNPYGNQVVWAWKEDGILHPLNNLKKCLTNLGWKGESKRSFNLENCTGNTNQIWKYDQDSKTIANSTSAPIKSKTKVMDRYGEMITWNYSGSYKQGWITSSQIIEDLKSHSKTLKYPVALGTGADNSVIEPESMAIERKKMAINALLSTYGSTPYSRDFTSFPGAVPAGISTSEKRIVFDLSFDKPRGGRLNRLKNWKSTGMYAPPNQNIFVETSKHIEGISVRVNTHTDVLKSNSPNIKKEKVYRRSPIVSSSTPIIGNNVRNIIRSDMGGLIILESRDSREDILDVVIQGAVPAPYYNGSQSQAEWDKVCVNPVPWGELEGKHFVVTERSEKLCSLTSKQLDGMISYYDQLVSLHEELLGFNNASEADRKINKGKHRFVYDIQIKAGYAHAGFPMMTQWKLVDNASSKLDIWGNGHELGHMYQTSCLLSRFGGEVTVNLFTVNSMESMFPKILKTRLEPAYKRVLKKLKEGSLNFDQEKSSSHKLIFLLQIRNVTGWKPYQEIYRLYRKMSEEDKSKYCNNDQSKLDFFYRKISELSKMDLSSHFEAWKLPITKENLSLPQPPFDISLSTSPKKGKSGNRIVRLRNVATKRFLSSTGEKVKEKEGGWLKSPIVVGSHTSYDNRTSWSLMPVGNANIYRLKNVETGRYLFSTGDATTSVSEGGWLKSPPVVGTDANYYNRTNWNLIKMGTTGAYQLKNAKTQRYLFSTGERLLSSSEQDLSESFPVVGADANYYGRANWYLEDL